MTNPPNGTVPMATNKRPSYPTHGTPISSAAIHPMQPGMTRPIANSSTAEGRPLMTPSIPNTTGPTPGTMATGSTIPQQRQMSVHSQGGAFQRPVSGIPNSGIPRNGSLPNTIRPLSTVSPTTNPGQPSPSIHQAGQSVISQGAINGNMQQPIHGMPQQPRHQPPTQSAQQPFQSTLQSMPPPVQPIQSAQPTLQPRHLNPAMQQPMNQQPFANQPLQQKPFTPQMDGLNGQPQILAQSPMASAAPKSTSRRAYPEMAGSGQSTMMQQPQTQQQFGYAGQQQYFQQPQPTQPGMAAPTHTGAINQVPQPGFNTGFQSQPQQSVNTQQQQYPQQMQQQPGGGYFQPDVNQLSGQFGNMGMAGGLAGNAAPTAIVPTVNILHGPPQMDAFVDTHSMLNINNQSVSNSPMANPHDSYQRCTLNAIPQSSALLNKSRIPFGLLITPYKNLFPHEPQVPVITAPQIVRCRRCRTYINPWITFVENGARWKCNMCFLTNDVPAFFDWDADQRTQLNRLDRPELTHGVVEFVAPQEYMVRPPQPVVMIFVIDVTYAAIQSGMVSVAAKSIKDSLDKIPNLDGRTKIAFITVDSALHFYNLGSSSSFPQMMVVADLTETYLPMPSDLLVSLTESRQVIDQFLDKLPSLFEHTQQTQLAMGKALKAAQKLVGHIGGKIVVLEYTLVNYDDGALKVREDPKLFGTAKENGLLQPAIGFYKSLAVDCSPMQVSIDLFLFNPQYADVATLGGCAKFTGGSIHYYPRFSANRYEDSIKFASELGHLLTRPIGFEAVMRVRTTRGIKMKAFHGNFFLRSTDLLSLPNVSPDHSYAIEMEIGEDITTRMACFQTSLLHTSSSGERRIRVLTLAVPVTTNLSEVFSCADQLALTTLLTKKAVERALTSKIEDARDALMYKLHELIAVYKNQFARNGPSSQLLLPENLKLMPIYTLAMIKHLAFRQSTSIPSDLRSYMLALLCVFSPELIKVTMYPRFWNVDSVMTQKEIGTVGEGERKGQVVYPPQLNLTSEKLDRQGMYLLDNGLEMFLWVGKAANPQLCQSVLGNPQVDTIPSGKTTLPMIPNDDVNERVRGLIEGVRQERMIMGSVYLQLYVVKEDGDAALRMWFLSHLVEDRIEQLLSYPQFVGGLKEGVAKISV
ncbi:COPII subunit [Batrachochytrium dendrobatidis]